MVNATSVKLSATPRIRGVRAVLVVGAFLFGVPVTGGWAAQAKERRELRYGVYPPAFDHRVYEFATGAPFLPYIRRMKVVSGRQEIAPGLTAILTPGHSPGHQSLVVEAKGATYLLAGDFVDLDENWDKRIPSGPTPDVETWHRTYDELAQLDVVILPGHDGRILEREVYD